MILFNFLNINIELMRDQYPESNDWECLTKMLMFMLDIHSLQRDTTILDEVFTSYRLCINVSKTETMVLNQMFLEDEYPDIIMSLRNVPL